MAAQCQMAPPANRYYDEMPPMKKGYVGVLDVEEAAKLVNRKRKRDSNDDKENEVPRGIKMDDLPTPQGSRVLKPMSRKPLQQRGDGANRRVVAPVMAGARVGLPSDQTPRMNANGVVPARPQRAQLTSRKTTAKPHAVQYAVKPELKDKSKPPAPPFWVSQTIPPLDKFSTASDTALCLCLGRGSARIHSKACSVYQAVKPGTVQKLLEPPARSKCREDETLDSDIFDSADARHSCDLHDLCKQWACSPLESKRARQRMRESNLFTTEEVLLNRSQSCTSFAEVMKMIGEHEDAARDYVVNGMQYDLDLSDSDEEDGHVKHSSRRNCRWSRVAGGTDLSRSV